MSFGLNQAGADSIAGHVSGTMLSGSTNRIELLNAAGTAIGSANDLTLSASGNVVTFGSAGGINVTADGTAAGFSISTTSGAQEYFRFLNTIITVVSGDQSTGSNNFTSTAHPFLLGLPVIIGGTVPSTTPAVSDGDTVFISNVNINDFRIERSRGAGAVAIDTVNGDVTFTSPTAVGDASSPAILKITGGTAVTDGQNIPITSMTYSIGAFSTGIGAA